MSGLNTTGSGDLILGRFLLFVEPDALISPYSMFLKLNTLHSRVHRDLVDVFTTDLQEHANDASTKGVQELQMCIQRAFLAALEADRDCNDEEKRSDVWETSLAEMEKDALSMRDDIIAIAKANWRPVPPSVASACLVSSSSCSHISLFCVSICDKEHSGVSAATIS